MAEFTMKHIMEKIDLGLENFEPGKWRGKCPFHPSKNENKKHTCFNISEERGYICFSCGRSGGSISFIKDFYHLETYGSAHKYIYEHFNIKTDRYEEWESRVKAPYIEYLKNRGLTEKTINEFKLTPCVNGTYHHRIKIPVYNNGKEVGAVYRAIDDKEPRYLFEKGFSKSNYLYNSDSIPDKSKNLLLVEGLFSVFKIYQFTGRKSVVSSMGCNVSNNQLQLLIEKNLPVYVMMDGDEPGRRAAKKITDSLKDKLETKIVDLDDNVQPDELSKQQLNKIFKKYGL